MDLNKLYSSNRTGETSSSSKVHDPRSDYRRDFDRIVFSSAFRRLQNKTQVFPLPGTVFVHNRLTHSLEVASVGRSLGTLLGDFITTKYKSELNSDSELFYRYDLAEVASAACLCHDIGNPAFGHSGEDAIADYFVRNEKKEELRNCFSNEEWTDFTHFEGNANSIRSLAGQQSGKAKGGLGLTYSTLASILKYPCSSSHIDKANIARKKFGYFQSETDVFNEIAQQTNMLPSGTNCQSYCRHPFVWLVEAADDICYNIIDLEDAHRLRIIDHAECVEILKQLIFTLEVDNKKRIESTLKKITDKNDQVSYLRAKSINALIVSTKELYMENFDAILSGTLNTPLYNLVKCRATPLASIEQFSIDNIYNHRSVVEIENAGYNVMYELLDHFIGPVLKAKSQRSNAEKKAVALIPGQFLYEDQSNYLKVMGVLDYVSGMTDNYAADSYKKIKGISMGMNIVAP